MRSSIYRNIRMSRLQSAQVFTEIAMSTSLDEDTVRAEQRAPIWLNLTHYVQLALRTGRQPFVQTQDTRRFPPRGPRDDIQIKGSLSSPIHLQVVMQVCDAHV